MISKTTPEKIVKTGLTNDSLIGKTIPFLGGRPQRESIIGNDDIMNLLIACNTCSTLEDFFKVT